MPIYRSYVKVKEQHTPIDIQVVSSKKQELLIGANWINKYQANLLLGDENKRVTFKVNGKPFETKLTATQTKRQQINMLTNPDECWMEAPETAWYEDIAEQHTMTHQQPQEFSRWEEKNFTYMGRYQ